MTHATHQALRELDRVLADVEGNDLPFNMRTWGFVNECKTSARCAGWAMRDGWFADHGLRPEDRWLPWPSFRGEYIEDALAAFFCLGEEDVDALFFANDATITDQRAVIASLLATVPDRVVEGGL